jgi:D-alanyl-lipoteichoic acid acyltransferase DltB (MBOAT superfamily)
MDTASFQFVGYGLLVALLANLSKSRHWRSGVLLAASILFLVLLSKDLLLLVPLFGFLVLGYTGLVLIEHGWSKYAVFSILAVLLAYVWLKKYSFLPEGSFIHAPYLTLGLSYIFFRILHLLIEAGDDDKKQHIPPLAYLLYTINFTTFISGPIQRYNEFARDQFAVEPAPLGPRVVGLQFERIVRGFFKVNVLAALLHMVQDDALAQLFQPLPSSLKLMDAAKLLLIYPLFLYANFSGYIDIVIGLARLMRVCLPENFDRPFAATSVLDFWAHWHMTLSNWFKRYIYNPLLISLMRRISSPAAEPFLGVFCFFVTFFLVGVWHGRSSEFLMYGVLTGGGISLNKLWQLQLTRTLGRKGYKELAKNVVYQAFGRGLTFCWFGFTLFWFWSDWKQLDRVFAAMGGAQWAGALALAWLCATATLALWEWLHNGLMSFRIEDRPIFTHRYALTVYASAMAMFSIIMTVLLNQPAPGIVYKAF